MSRAGWRSTRGLVVVGLTGVSCWLAVGPAAAQPEGPSVFVRPNPAASGERVEVLGADFCTSPACSAVTVSIGRESTVTASVDPDGRFSVHVTAPLLAGSYPVTAAQSDGDATVHAETTLFVGTSDTSNSGPVPTATSPPESESTAAPSSAGGTSVPSSGRPPDEASSDASTGTERAEKSGIPAIVWVMIGFLAIASLAGALAWRRRRSR